MSHELILAKKLFDEELDKAEQAVMDSWRKHVATFPLDVVKKQFIEFDHHITNDGIESLKRDNAIELRTVTLNDTQLAKLRAKYESLMASESDQERINKLRKAGKVAPPIFAGDDDNWWVYDGMHRMALAANQQYEQFPAWFITHARHIKEVQQKQEPIVDKEALLQIRINMFKEQSDAVTERLYSGDISIGQFQEEMKQLIKSTRTATAAIGKGGWEKMGPRDWGRLGTPLREQYKYLKNYAQYISDNRDTLSLRYLKNRSQMYGDSTTQAAIQAEAGFFFEDNLPWLPKDGSTSCGGRCHCKWVLTVVETQKNYKIVNVTWTLGTAEHCEATEGKDGCVERAGHVEVLKVPNDVTIPSQIGGY